LNKLITMQEAVKKYTWDGITFAHGGALPVGSDCTEFFRELVRQEVKNIHLVSNSNTPGTNLLIANGQTSHIEMGFSGLEVYGFANGLRRKVEAGEVIFEEYSNGGIPLKLLAGALGIPFIPTYTSVGSDQQYCFAEEPDIYPNPNKIPEISDPFSGKTLGALKSINPDLAVIHVTMADTRGNAIILGTEWNRFELSRAAKKVILQADYIVDTECMRQFPNLVRIPDFLVEAVVYSPLGVWPSCSTGVYDSDEEHFFLMNESLKTDEGTQSYIDEYVLSYHSTEEYRELIGTEKERQLTASNTAFLMDPYRKYIKLEIEIKELLEGEESQWTTQKTK